jgi:hypothetical protein
LIALALDDATRAHLVAAIRRYCDYRAGSGEAVPDGLAELEQALMSAPGRQEAPAAAIVELSPNVDGVPPLAYTIPEAAQAAGVGERTMERLVADGAVRSKLIGRRRIVPVDGLRDFLNDTDDEGGTE